MPSRVRSRLVGAASLAGVVALAAACGGGGGSSPTNAAAPTTTTAAAASGQQMSQYVQCLKDHGISVPVDANGNPTFGPRGGSGADTSTPPASDTPTSTPASTFDRNAFQQARQACGTPPGRDGGGNGAPVDPQAAQQAALQLAACLREQGLNVPDPDFSTTTASPPASATGTSGSGGGGGFRGGGGAMGAILRNLDRNDPTVQAALQQCQADIPNRGRGTSTTAPATTTG
jgi:hypothetical protein